MCEIKVVQRTEEWHGLRNRVLLTASAFGDALGLGRGKPYDFLSWLLSDDKRDKSDSEMGKIWTEHGIRLEPIVGEAYQLLTGQQTTPSGFWIPVDGDPLSEMVGASPDALLYEKSQCGQCAKLIGLVEFKAPFYKMYTEGIYQPHAIPRQYMAQMQGQMAICQVPWCDFMAICTATREIMLKRVFFHPIYWVHVSEILKEFCYLAQIAKTRHYKGLEQLNFPEAVTFRAKKASSDWFPGEKDIVVQNLLSVKKESSDGRPSLDYKSLSGRWMSYEFLLGRPSPSCDLERDLSNILNKIDREISDSTSRDLLVA